LQIGGEIYLFFFFHSMVVLYEAGLPSGPLFNSASVTGAQPEMAGNLAQKALL